MNLPTNRNCRLQQAFLSLYLAPLCPNQEFPVHPCRGTEFFLFIGHAFAVEETLCIDAGAAAFVGVDLNLDHVDASA